MSNSATTGQSRSLPAETIDFAHRMFDAARDGNSELLLSAVDVGLPANLTNSQGNTLLMLAAYSGHADLTQSLVSRGADVDRVNDRGQTPLAGAVFKGHNEVVRILRSAGANPRLGVPTAIQAARMFNRKEMLDTLGASEGDMEEAVPLPIPPPPTGA